MARKPGTPRPPFEGDLLDRPGYITPVELAEYLQVPVSTVDHWGDDGPRFKKIGKYKRYLGADVREWIKNRPGGGSPAKTAA